MSKFVLKTPKMENKDNKNSYMQYSSMAFELLAAIALGVFVGIKLDKWTGTRTPWFGVVGSLLGIFAGLYLFIKRLPKN
jgi:F0F1-type ATP synthase assembly protein I